MTYITARHAEALGFTVDRTCYPWFAYKGPRFQPTEITNVVTPRYPKRRR